MRGRVIAVLSGDEATRRAYANSVPAGSLFVELQDAERPIVGARFYASGANNVHALMAARAAGQPARGWEYDQGDPAALAGYVTLPATDTPYDPWYVQRCAAAGAIR